MATEYMYMWQSLGTQDCHTNQSINQILFMCHLCMHTTSLKRLMRHNVQRGISGRN